MTSTSMKGTASGSPGVRQAGSALLAAVSLLAVTALVVGVALSEARQRFRIGHHSARWAQAANAAEGGIELALMSAQKNQWTTNGWTSAPGAPGAAPVTKDFTLSTDVPATGPVSATVQVDKVAVSGTSYLRIRSTGKADVFGGAVAGSDPRDVLLRKLSLRRDRITGASLATPRATRTLEVLAKPMSKFRRAILLDSKFNMTGGGMIDSFDSSDSTKSTNNQYDAAKRQANADVGVNDTQGASDLGSTYVYGDVAYSGPSLTRTENVQGTVSSPFNEPTERVLAPTWTSISANPNVITSTMTLRGGSKDSPKRYKVSSFNIDSSTTVTMAAHAGGKESYIEIWVTGDLTTTGQSVISQQPGVHVTYYVEGNVTATGGSFVNQTNVAANNVINVVTPAAGTIRTVNFSGGGKFIGAINAPSADFDLAGNSDFYGALIGKTMLIRGGGSFHYDEALARGEGTGGAYKVVSWVEGVR